MKMKEDKKTIHRSIQSKIPTNAEAQELFDKIKEKWDNYFQNCKEMDLENREFTTGISRNVSSLQWTISTSNHMVWRAITD